MRYTPLIIRLVESSIEAIEEHHDIADRLKGRCIEETDLIRQTLMNLVCDPRFKIFAGTGYGDSNWQHSTISALEAFASKLERTNLLSEGKARDMLEEFLSNWFEKRISNLTSNGPLLYEPCSRKTSKYMSPTESVNKMTKALGELGVDTKDEEQFLRLLSPEKYMDDTEEKDDSNGDNSSDHEGSDSKKSDKKGKKSGDGSEDSDGESEKGNRDECDGNGAEKTTIDDEDEGETEDIGKTEDNDSNKKERGIGYGNTINQKQVDDKYLKSIPHGLLELAKRIGRVGEDEEIITGKFLTASKCDIAGITTGNNLNCMLPTELALLADTRTRDIFYKNYVTKQLQLFASASSSSKKGEKHQEGPIIICLDTSSSMNGEPILVAKALTYAILIIAQRRHRQVLLVPYSNSYRTMRIEKYSKQKKEVHNFLSNLDMSGNDENNMFNGLFTKNIPLLGDFDSADILCISDFGWSPISRQNMELIQNAKDKGMIFYGLNINRGLFDEVLFDEVLFSEDYQHGMGLPKDVCDSMWVYSSGNCEEILNKKS